MKRFKTMAKFAVKRLKTELKETAINIHYIKSR